MLEERGDEVAADTLRGGELAQALAAVRAETLDSPEAVQLRFDYIMVEERERVANAAVLAELLAPMLGARAPAASFASAPHAAEASVEAPAVAPSAVAAAPAPERPRPADIADFIDEMLAQERTDPHGHRRAS